jgi:phosphoribosylformimino-5-aminoimidazole carboxamide ribotide isomerase
MRIYPAIDLMDGKCVRLSEGKFENRTDYSKNPMGVVKAFETSGSEYLHIVDLDGAKAGASSQLDLLTKMIRSTNMKVQVGGGLRRSEDLERLFASGADQVIIGSLAFKDPEVFATLVRQFGNDRITVAVDFQMKDGVAMIATHGWQNTSTTSVKSALRHFGELKLKRFLCTDISKDGRLEGTNSAFYKELQQEFPDIELLASGGVSSLDDLKLLKKEKAFGVIVGKALYEKRFSLTDALTLAGDEVC